MSPEQIRGETLDVRSDVFSLGIVLHQCLTGVRLFYGKTPSQEIEAALKTVVHPPSRQNPMVPPELDAIVLKALQRERSDRYDSALEMARALDNAVGDLIWSPEQRAEFVVSHFSSRREKVRAFISEMQAGLDHTGEISLKLFLPPQPHGRATTALDTRVPATPPPSFNAAGDSAGEKTLLHDEVVLPPLPPPRQTSSSEPRSETETGRTARLRPLSAMDPVPAEGTTLPLQVPSSSPLPRKPTREQLPRSSRRSKRRREKYLLGGIGAAGLMLSPRDNGSNPPVD
jgi:serine/threonine protein kinase